MVDANTSDGAPGAPENHEGVLLNLPRTRPQRASARRAASRASNGSSPRPRKPAGSKRANSKPATEASPESARAKRPGSGATASAAAKPRSKPKPRATPKRRTQVRHRATSSAAKAEAAPRQGFESETEAPTGTVHPPGGTELVASAVEIVGELAKAGLSTGERLLKDVFSRMPLS